MVQLSVLDLANIGEGLTPADALANAGRGVEAGEAYLACVEHLPEDAIELRRLAGEGFLTSAAIDRGREVLAALLEERGVTFPATRNKAIAGLVKNLLALRLRGTRFTRVPDEAIAPETREQLELLQTDSSTLTGDGAAAAAARPLRDQPRLEGRSDQSQAAGDRRSDPRQRVARCQRSACHGSHPASCPGASHQPSGCRRLPHRYANQP